MDLLPASSLLSWPELRADARAKGGFVFRDLAVPVWIYSSDQDPANDSPAITGHSPLSSTQKSPAVYLWELGTHMCCYMGHKLTTHDAKSRKNLNRKRAKENEGVGEGAAVNHVWKRLTAGGERVHDLCIAATGRSKSWHGTRCYANPYIMKTSKIWWANDPWPSDICLLPHMELETPSIHLEFQCSEREWYDTWDKLRSIYQWSLITYHHDLLIKAIKTTLHCPSLLPSQDITLRVIFKCLICSAGPFVLNDFLMACIWKSFEEIKIQEQSSFIYLSVSCFGKAAALIMALDCPA